MASMRKLLNLFLVVSLLAAQWAGHAHALSHAEHDLSVAHAALGQEDDGCDHEPQPLDHSIDHCVAFHALDAVGLAFHAVVSESASPSLLTSLPHVLPRLSEPVPFSSRAPPVSLS
jgi:hypothetical protein